MAGGDVRPNHGLAERGISAVHPPMDLHRSQRAEVAGEAFKAATMIKCNYGVVKY